MAKYVGPCLQVRVSQRLAELACRPPVPVKISGRQVTEGPALERHLQGLIQQLSLTGEAEQSLYLQLIAWCCVTQHCPAVCSVASPMGEWWLQTGTVVYSHLVPVEACLGVNSAQSVGVPANSSMRYLNLQHTKPILSHATSPYAVLHVWLRGCSAAF